MFKDRLYIISEDLQKHHRDRDEVFALAVKGRLNKGLLSYLDDIDKSCKYLMSREGVGILRRINRGVDKNDKSAK